MRQTDIDTLRSVLSPLSDGNARAALDRVSADITALRFAGNGLELRGTFE